MVRAMLHDAALPQITQELRGRNDVNAIHLSDYLPRCQVAAAVEVAVGDGFHDVVGADGDGAVKVANGTFVSINILCCKGAFAF